MRRLSSGELPPQLFPTEDMKKMFARLPNEMDSLGYLEGKGLLQLREAVSRHLQTKGIKATPSSILIVSGALQGFQLIAMGLLKRSSVVLVENPSYLYSLRVFSVHRNDFRKYSNGQRRNIDKRSN